MKPPRKIQLPEAPPLVPEGPDRGTANADGQSPSPKSEPPAPPAKKIAKIDLPNLPPKSGNETRADQKASPKAQASPVGTASGKSPTASGKVTNTSSVNTLSSSGAESSKSGPSKKSGESPQAKSHLKSNTIELNSWAALFGVIVIAVIIMAIDSTSNSSRSHTSPTPNTTTASPSYSPPPIKPSISTQRPIVTPSTPPPVWIPSNPSSPPPSASKATPAPEPTWGPAELAELKAKIQELIALRDSEYQRLDTWYQRGVRASEANEYKRQLKDVEKFEADLASAIEFYNQKKRELK